MVEILPKSERVHFRFLDEDFAVVVAQFLESGAQSISFKPEDGFTLDDFGADGFEQSLADALRGTCADRIHLAVAKHRLSQYIPDAHLKIIRDEDDELVVVDTHDYFGYYMRSGVPQRDDVYTPPSARLDISRRGLTRSVSDQTSCTASSASATPQYSPAPSSWLR